MVRDLYKELCSYENLVLAFKKARKHKTLKPCVIEYEKNLKENLLQLRAELLLKSYRTMPLKIFILKDPKTRKISVSDFRDRIVHHALCNIIQPFFETAFIYDSYANRIGKGTFKAIERFDFFKNKISHNNSRACFVLKADIRHYFEEVSHDILIDMLRKKIKDPSILWLVRIILENHLSKNKGKGMPLGNLTSQFFANVYLNELDQFIKHKLKAKYYVRYVDDFLILDSNKGTLKRHILEINVFLADKLSLQLHHEKTRIIRLEQGVPMLGFRIFQYHKLIQVRNIRKFRKKLAEMLKDFNNQETEYDAFYDFVEGWIAYSKHANTHNLSIRLLEPAKETMLANLSTKEINRFERNQRANSHLP